MLRDKTVTNVAHEVDAAVAETTTARTTIKIATAIETTIPPMRNLKIQLAGELVVAGEVETIRIQTTQGTHQTTPMIQE